MKKLSLILTGVVLFGGLSFASPLVKQDKAKTSTTKTAAKPATKKVVKKAPVKKAASDKKVTK
jgi:hypothetical protein